MPLMNSSHSCEQEISNRDRIITKTSCCEVHVFRPFASEDSGATTEVTYKLEFQRKTDGVSNQPGSNYRPTSVTLDHCRKNYFQNANQRSQGNGTKLFRHSDSLYNIPFLSVVKRSTLTN